MTNKSTKLEQNPSSSFGGVTPTFTNTGISMFPTKTKKNKKIMMLTTMTMMEATSR